MLFVAGAVVLHLSLGSLILVSIVAAIISAAIGGIIGAFLGCLGAAAVLKRASESES
jgi:ABC-type microcin C transport system permease subunit YejE